MNKKYFLVLYCIFFYCYSSHTFLYAQNNSIKDSLILWSNKPLSPLDFNIIPDTSNTGFLVAYTFSNLNYMYRTGRKGSQEIIEIKIVNSFLKNKSWIKKSYIQDSFLLAHEQGHFDIGEIFARNFFKKMDSINLTSEYISKLNKLSKEIGRGLDAEQIKYDIQTNHGRNIEMQEKWSRNIKSSLDTLKKYYQKSNIYKISKSL